MSYRPPSAPVGPPNRDQPNVEQQLEQTPLPTRRNATEEVGVFAEAAMPIAPGASDEDRFTSFVEYLSGQAEQGVPAGVVRDAGSYRSYSEALEAGAEALSNLVTHGAAYLPVLDAVFQLERGLTQDSDNRSNLLEAIKVLASQGDMLATRTLVTFGMQSRDTEIRTESAVALGSCKYDAAVQALVSLGMSDSESTVIEATKDSLMQFPSEMLEQYDEVSSTSAFRIKADVLRVVKEVEAEHLQEWKDGYIEKEEIRREEKKKRRNIFSKMLNPKPAQTPIVLPEEPKISVPIHQILEKFETSQQEAVRITILALIEEEQLTAQMQYDDYNGSGYLSGVCRVKDSE